MAKGRKTGGRQKGTANKKTRELADKAAAQGITPLEYMLGILRAKRSTDELKRWAAEKAAPYIHPRLQSTTVTGDFNHHNHTSELSDADLERIAATGKKPKGKAKLAAVVPINGASRTASNEQPVAASPPAVGEVGAEPTSAA